MTVQPYHDRPELASLAKLRGKRFDGVAFRRLFGLPANTPHTSPAPKTVPERARQSSIIKRLLRAAVRAGFTPTGFKLNSNGEITVFTKEGTAPSSPTNEELNEWDQVDGAD